MANSNSSENPNGSWLGSGNSLARALSSVLVQNVKVNTEDESPLPVIGFFLKGTIITSDFSSSFAGERAAAGGWRTDKVSGSSDRRGAKGETELAVAFPSSDIISSNFLLVSCKEVIISSFRSFWGPIKVSTLFSLFGPMASFSNCAHKNINFGICNEPYFGHFRLRSPLV